MQISSKKIAITGLIYLLLSTNIFASELACNVNIDCNRFDYASKADFNESVINYAAKWSLNTPVVILRKVSETHEVNIRSIDDGLSLIEKDPGLIYVIGKDIERNKKPKEWLYIFEQSFLRKFNNLQR